jgi:hypothetical protein
MSSLHNLDTVTSISRKRDYTRQDGKMGVMALCVSNVDYIHAYLHSITLS